VVFHERLLQFTDQDGHYSFVVYRSSFVMMTSTQEQHCVPGIRSLLCQSALGATTQQLICPDCSRLILPKKPVCLFAPHNWSKKWVHYENSHVTGKKHSLKYLWDRAVRLWLLTMENDDVLLTSLIVGCTANYSILPEGSSSWFSAALINHLYLHGNIH